MTEVTGETTERAELLRRLSAQLGRDVAEFENSSLFALREIVEGCEAQEKLYADCGFVDAQAR